MICGLENIENEAGLWGFCVCVCVCVGARVGSFIRLPLKRRGLSMRTELKDARQ